MRNNEEDITDGKSKGQQEQGYYKNLTGDVIVATKTTARKYSPSTL